MMRAADGGARGGHSSPRLPVRSVAPAGDPVLI